MKELMGIETIELFEQTQVGVSKNPVTAKVTGVSVDSEVGTSSTNQGTEDFAQGYVDADGALGALRNAIGTTPISQGLVNEVVLDYHYKTGPFTLKYSFSNDVKTSTGVIPKNKTFTTKNANYIGLTDQGQTISVDMPDTIEKTDDDGDTTNLRNRNKKIVDLFKSVDVIININDKFIPYFRKNIRPILRRLKSEFPEYGINFTDKPSTEIVYESFIRINNILIETYSESLKQLMDLKAAKETQKKDKKMGTILDKEIEKEKKKLVQIIKPKFKKVFGKNGDNLTDDDLVNLILSLNTFIKGLKEDYPQYRISFKENIIKEEDELEVEKVEIPKTMLINLNNEQEVVFISRKYPCTVSIDDKVTGQNTIHIVDVTSRYVYKGGAKTTNQKGNVSGDTTTNTDGHYVLPIYNALQDDKGKTFEVKMSIDIDPQVYLNQNNEHVGNLRKHEGDIWKYKVRMMDNGFEVIDIKTSQGETVKLPSDAKIRMLFSRGTEKVFFDKKYQVTVLQDNNTLGKLNLTVGDISRETSGF
tara:strand:- start:16969 stop:18558 length:1590 start_codon:yes stop_codon:yes gene_type:complete